MKNSILAIAVSSVAATSSHAGSVTSSGENLVISTDGGFKIHTEDKSKSFQIGGRLQWDYDDTNSDSDDSTDFDVRRARIYVKGSINDWAYKAQFNIAEGDGAEGGDAEDLYLRYTGWGKQAYLTVGKQKEPFGLEALTSSKDISALERGAITEMYAPGRSGGIQFSGKNSNITYAIGVFEADGDSDNDFDNTAVTGRITFNPINDGGSIVHLGAAFSHRDGDTSADEVDAYGLELAAAMGSLHAQAEYMDAEFGTMDADGYYLQLGYILTGESRPYKDGVFKRVKPADSAGAWEVVLRIDEGDGKYNDIGVGSGDGTQTTVGLNWYANQHVKLGVSYMDGENDDSNEDGKELRIRAQFVF